MKKLLVLVVAMAMASSAFAVIDPDANSIGIYADMEADIVAMDVVAFVPTNIYLILTNPDFAELYGFEAGYHFDGNVQILSALHANPQALDVGGTGNHIVGFGAPTPCTEATLLTTIQFLAFDANPIGVFLTGTDPSSNDLGLPTLLLDGGELSTGGGTSTNGEVSLSINGFAPVVATEEATFDSVKSLYR